jgi:hypothetical protein
LIDLSRQSDAALRVEPACAGKRLREPIPCSTII